MTASIIEKRVAQIRKKIAKSRLKDVAARAGLNPSTLVGAEKEDWNPRLATIVAVEKGLFPGKANGVAKPKR